MNPIKLIAKLRLLSSTVPLTVLSFLSFIVILLALSLDYSSHLKDLSKIITTSEIQSQKMRLNSELMELARARTRITSQIIDTDDIFKQDELNLTLENYAARFAGVRQQLLTLELSDEERKILQSHNEIVPIILPAQRRAVELAMSDSPEDKQLARKILYEQVLPGQGQMIDSIGAMISLEQQHISASSKQSAQLTRQTLRNSSALIGMLILAIILLAFFVIRRILKIQNKLVRSYQNMEKKVKQRTHELNSARDDMKRYIDIVDKHVITSHTDKRGIIMSTSDAFCRISQYSPDELLGNPHNIVRHPDMDKSLYAEMWATIKQGESWRGEIKNRAKDGSAYWVDVNIEPDLDQNNEISGYTAIRHDITDKKRIEELSLTDALTQLNNRSKLDSALSYEIDRAKRYEPDLSLILLDIDHFKAINDNYGHLVGDEILIAIADLIKHSIRKTDIAGRWGGEEFMIICPDTNVNGAEVLAEKLRLKIANFDFSQVGPQSSSFGVAAYLKDESETDFVQRADSALYKAKELGRNRVCIAGQH